MSNKAIAVKCDTLEQKQEVIRYARGEKKESMYDPGSSDCINMVDGSHCPESYYRENGYTVISFSDFKTNYKNKTNSVLSDIGTLSLKSVTTGTSSGMNGGLDSAKYVECINDSTPNTTRGRIYKTGKIRNSWINDNGREDAYTFNNQAFSLHFKPSTEQAYLSQQQNKTFKFNVGDKVRSIEGGVEAHDPSSKNSHIPSSNYDTSPNVSEVVDMRIFNNKPWYRIKLPWGLVSGNWISEEGLELAGVPLTGTVLVSNGVTTHLVDPWKSSTLTEINYITDFGIKTELLTPYEAAIRFPGTISSPTQPSRRISVNTHNEFKIEVKKQKSIKI